MSHFFLQGCEYSVRVSFLEIYNEELTDLLGAESVENPRLKIYEDVTKKVNTDTRWFIDCMLKSNFYIFYPFHIKV